MVARAALFFSDHGNPAGMRSSKRTMPDPGTLDQTDGVTVAPRGRIDRPIASNTKRREPGRVALTWFSGAPCPVPVRHVG